MNSSKVGPPGGPRMPRRPSRKSTAGIVLACAAAAYTFLVPIVNERFGTNLPQLRNGGQVTAPSATSTSARSTDTSDSRGPLADRMNPSAKTSADAKATAGGDPNLKYGLLRDLGGEKYMSPAGLLYTRGSQEGHRLKHLERHTKDDPGRPGPHGVFDGGMEKALVTIDKAYDRAKKKQRTTVEKDGRRTIYVVDMGGRIGFVGGQTGKRKRNPMARRVQLVLEDNRVITAYPK